MIDFNDYYYFVQVVEKRGFSAAGRVLNIPKSSLSRRIQQLETRLQARLIQRTSRSFIVTDVGQEFYQHARAMLIEAEAAEAAVKRRLAEPSGTVRFSCSVAMAQFALVDLLPRFMDVFPKVNIIQQATNRYVDLIDEGFDLGLRAHTGPLPDSSLIQRPLAPTPWHLVAGSAYLKRAGTPAAPDELAAHSGLILGGLTGESHWNLRHREGATATVPFSPRLRSDDMVTLKKAAHAGLGIVALPGYICRTDIQQGMLQRILPDWTAGDAMISLLMPSRRGLLPAVGAFAEFLRDEFPIVVAC